MIKEAVNVLTGDILLLETKESEGDSNPSSFDITTLRNDLDDLGDQVQAIQGDVNALKTGSSAFVNNNGIRADYALKYGITDCPNDIITFNSTDKEITIHHGVVLSMPNKENKVMFGNDTTYEVEEIGNVVLFYTQTESESGVIQQGFIEAGTVHYGEDEPTDGVTSFLAWWQPSKGRWQFKSIYTGNVWREADAQPIANIKASSSIITSVNYIGYRIIDDDIFAQLEDIAELETKIAQILTRLDALEAK